MRMAMLEEAREIVEQVLVHSLETGPWGIVALTTMVATLVHPLVQYRTMYGTSIGYGSTVAFVSLMLRKVFSVSLVSMSVENLLTLAALFYGVRLTLYLYVREQFWGYPPNNPRPDPSRIARIPFSMLLSLLYACMSCPLLYVMRNPPLFLESWHYKVAMTGVGLAWSGAIMESIADTHKLVVKARHRKKKHIFCGPHQGLYAWTRHANYTGEILFWFGVWLAGLPCLQDSYPGYFYSTLGLCAIVTIMQGATTRLETCQEENYGHQEVYQRWKRNVPAPLIPFVEG